MHEIDLERELAILGLGGRKAKLIALLPLVEVAWADGTIQESERTVILEAGRTRFGLDDAGLAILEGWLRTRPAPAVVRGGRRVLAALCADQGLVCDDVVTLAREVAGAAGGQFGFGAIDAREARVIDEIAEALGIPDERPWILPHEETQVPGDADLESEGPPVTVTIHAPWDGRSPATLVHYDPDRGDQICGVGDVAVTIGRADDNVVQIEYDAQVSRHHCEIQRDSRGFVLRDLGSVSGTWVDGMRISEQPLIDGQTVRVGSTSLFFQRS